MDPLIVYFSSMSLNTHRFVEQLGFRARRIPISIKAAEMERVDEPFILICPTYADDDGSRAVPKQVIRFLNNPENRGNMQGVIASGNRNFGEMFAYAGHVISRKCGVPLLYKFELSGTPTDSVNIQNGVEKLWNSLELTSTKMKVEA